MNQENILKIKEEVEGLENPEERIVMLKKLLGPELSSLISENTAPETDEELLDRKIQSLKAKGMTSGGIKKYFKDMEGLNVSDRNIREALDKNEPEMREWLDRPLEQMYPIIFLDGMRFRVKDNGRTVNKCSHHIIGINMDGQKELLGIWIADNEGAKYWGQILQEIKNRGVEDMLIACMDGLKGLPEALQTVFPDTHVQLCINHLTRSTTRFIKGDAKEGVYSALKTVYCAPTEKAALSNLEDVIREWSEFEALFFPWKERWPEIAPFFNFTDEVRRLIYTTNHVESLHSQFRRRTRSTPVFASEDTLRLALFAAQREITQKWVNPIMNWGRIVSELKMTYGDRLEWF